MAESGVVLWDLEEGTLGANLATSYTYQYTIGGDDEVYASRRGTYVAGRGGGLGFGPYAPQRGGSRIEMGVYGPTSVDGWENPIEHGQVDIDFRFVQGSTVTTTGHNMNDNTRVIDIQCRSADMNDQEDFSVGFEWGDYGSGENVYMWDEYLGMVDYDFAHYTAVMDQWYHFRADINEELISYTVRDSSDAVIFTREHVLDDGWRAITFLSTYPSTIKKGSGSIGTDWADVQIDNLRLEWFPPPPEPEPPGVAGWKVGVLID